MKKKSSLNYMNDSLNELFAANENAEIDKKANEAINIFSTKRRSRNITNTRATSSTDVTKLIELVYSLKQEVSDLRKKVGKMSVNGGTFSLQQSINQLSEKIAQKANSSELLALKNNVITSDNLSLYVKKTEYQALYDVISSGSYTNLNTYIKNKVDEEIENQIGSSFSGKLAETLTFVDGANETIKTKMDTWLLSTFTTIKNATEINKESTLDLKLHKAISLYIKDNCCTTTSTTSRTLTPSFVNGNNNINTFQPTSGGSSGTISF